MATIKECYYCFVFKRNHNQVTVRAAHTTFILWIENDLNVLKELYTTVNLTVTAFAAA